MDPANLDWQGAVANLAAGVLFLCGMLWASWRLWRRPRERNAPTTAKDGPEGEPYRVFTKAHDVELTAADIPARLRKLSPLKRTHYAKAELWVAQREHLLRFDSEQAPVAQIEQTLRGAIDDPAGLTLCLLIDQSGSMKGAPIAAVASAIRVVSEALTRIGVPTEILGFSTAGWQGGFPRQEWLRQGRPRRPGRLCALAHIVYKRADETEWSRESRDAFLHPDVLRENVDGEAIEWAAARLEKLPATRKLLVVLSDGAPVDDSTLLENGPSYLVRHLHSVIARIEGDDRIQLAAIGIEHDVSKWYRNGRQASVTSLTGTLTSLIGDLA